MITSSSKTVKKGENFHFCEHLFGSIPILLYLQSIKSWNHFLFENHRNSTQFFKISSNSNVRKWISKVSNKKDPTNFKLFFHFWEWKTCFVHLICAYFSILNSYKLYFQYHHFKQCLGTFDLPMALIRFTKQKDKWENVSFYDSITFSDNLYDENEKLLHILLTFMWVFKTNEHKNMCVPHSRRIEFHYESDSEKFIIFSLGFPAHKI